MKVFIPAAGLGTRLRPFTLTNPKALVEVDGIPMLQRVIEQLKSKGFDDIVINLHHFGEKIRDFVRAHDDFGVRVRFSDESDCLLETGGALWHARELLWENDEPFLIHNVDILSNAPLGPLMNEHKDSGAAATLLVSERESSRRLLFDDMMNLRGWHNLNTDEYKPRQITDRDLFDEFAFSGIHVMSPSQIFPEMERQGREGVFSVIDFYLEAINAVSIKGKLDSHLRMIDIGKPDTLATAKYFLESLRE